MLNKLIAHKLFWIVLFVAQSILFFLFSKLPREEGILVQLFFALLLACYFFTLKYLSDNLLKLSIVAAIVFRALMLFGIPWLSDDFYRFVWDGYLSFKGMNPFFV